MNFFINSSVVHSKSFESFIKKFKEDNKLYLTEIPISVETDIDGVIIVFDKEGKFNPKEENHKEYLIWVNFYKLLVQHGNAKSNNSYLVDRFYISTLINSFSDMFSDDENYQAEARQWQARAAYATLAGQARRGGDECGVAQATSHARPTRPARH